MSVGVDICPGVGGRLCTCMTLLSFDCTQSKDSVDPTSDESAEVFRLLSGILFTEVVIILWHFVLALPCAVK